MLVLVSLKNCYTYKVVHDKVSVQILDMGEARFYEVYSLGIGRWMKVDR